jgi:hypothetical protein
MKYLITFGILLACLAASAQRDVLTDSLSYENRSGEFFEVRKIEYVSGDIDILLRRLGDTATFANFLSVRYEERAQQWAIPAAQTAQQRTTLVALQQVQQAATAMLGQNVLDVLRARYAPSLVGQYRLRLNGGTPIACEIVQPTATTIQIRGLPEGNKAIRVRSAGWIDILNYPASPTATTIVLVRAGVWADVAGNITLVKISD